MTAHQTQSSGHRVAPDPDEGGPSWKAYRRQATTINYSGQLPLAQGVECLVRGGSVAGMAGDEEVQQLLTGDRVVAADLPGPSVGARSLPSAMATK